MRIRRKTTFVKIRPAEHIAFVSCVADQRLWGVMISVCVAFIAASLILNLGAASLNRTIMPWQSPNARLPQLHQRRGLANQPASDVADKPTRKLQMSLCLNKVLRLEYAHSSICSPRHWTIEQLVGVVVQYVDSRPARLHEDFTKLAIEALQATWPCARGPSL